MEPLGHVASPPGPVPPRRVRRGGRGAVLAGALLAALSGGEAAGQPGGLFREVASPAAVAGRDVSAVSDSITLRRRLVAIDLGQLTPPADAAAAAPEGVQAAPSGVLTLNLFDNASFTGLVQSVASTFSGGYSLSGPLAGVEMGTMTLVVNGDVVAGTVRTPEVTYRIRPAGAGLHAVSQIDPSRLPPLGEPIPGRGWEDEERPPLGPDGGPPGPVEPRVAPPVPGALRVTEDTPSADAEGSIATDRAALEALYDTTDGPNWTDSTKWKTDAPLGEWFGVTTDADGRVTELLLADNALTGPIPAELGNLTIIENLVLGSNELTGRIPRELGDFVRLWQLHLPDNDLTGPIPTSLGSLVNLERLFLSRNELTGPIPSELGSLVNLKWLHLSTNELTGPIPTSLGSLVNLESLGLSRNGLTGPIPPELGNLVNLRGLGLHTNDLAGPIPASLGSLINLEALFLSNNWGLTGPLPQDLRSSPLERLGIFATPTCAPAVWRDWLRTIEVFNGRLCGARTDVTIDVAVVYTPGAREAAGGVAAIEAEIDLMVAETNQAYEASGVHHRLALVERSEVSYAETGDSRLDLRRLRDPSDGHMDGVHEMRDRVGADLVQLVVGETDVSGIAYQVGAFSLVIQGATGRLFGHELGHNMGLQHERYEERSRGLSAHPSYGYVNQRAFEVDAPESSGWFTIMAYGTQCSDADVRCGSVLRFSNPRQQYRGDPLGVPYTGNGESDVTGPADAAAVLNATGPAVALWRDRPAGPNRAPTATGTLRDRRLALDGTLDVDVSQAFVDPDGDTLTYGVSSTAPGVVSVFAVGARVTLTAVAEGTATIRVTASDPGGLTATQTFTVTVGGTSAPFTDPEIVAGVTPVRAVHFTELRTRIDGLRTVAGLGSFAWTDPVLTAGVTRVRLVHLLELRSALAAAYAAAGRTAPRWTDPARAPGTTPIRAAHLMELRAAVVALE